MSVINFSTHFLMMVWLIFLMNVLLLLEPLFDLYQFLHSNLAFLGVRFSALIIHEAL